MSRDGWDLVPETEATHVELVPTRTGWVPAPGAPGRRAARAARVWLRECANPTEPSTYLGAGERALIRTHLHWPPSFTGVDDIPSVISVQMGRGAPDQAECDFLKIVV